MIAKLPNKNYELIDRTEIIEMLKNTKPNSYFGHDDNSLEAWLLPNNDHSKLIKIKYENLFDCKKTERLLKPECTRFKPRQFTNKQQTTIACTNDLKRELNKLKQGSQSYEMIIWDLILEHYDEI